jgi:hypothetical protein
MASTHQRQEAIQRGARMLRTALGPAIARFLEEPAVVKVMLNPGGRIWVDRLSEGLADTGETMKPADGERIVRLGEVAGASHFVFQGYGEWGAIGSPLSGLTARKVKSVPVSAFPISSWPVIGCGAIMCQP